MRKTYNLNIFNLHSVKWIFNEKNCPVHQQSYKILMFSHIVHVRILIFYYLPMILGYSIYLRGQQICSQANNTDLSFPVKSPKFQIKLSFISFLFFILISCYLLFSLSFLNLNHSHITLYCIFVFWSKYTYRVIFETDIFLFSTTRTRKNIQTYSYTQNVTDKFPF